MAKTQQGYSENSAENLQVITTDGTPIPLGEGQMLPKHVNDAVRSIMADTAVAAKLAGTPANRTPSLAVKVVADATATGSMPAVNGSKLEIDGAVNPVILFSGATDAAFTYTFDTSDSSVTGALRFYADAGQVTEITAGVTITGTAGTAGSQTVIAPTEATPRVLYYQIAGSTGLGGVAYVLGADDASAEAAAAAASATAAAGSATAAGQSEANAAASSSAANEAKVAAVAAKDGAASSETAASTSATNAAASQASATTSASAAATSAANAATSATAAATSETNAAASETAAATSETNAGTSATAAATSATSASTSATNAATSETNAAGSATAAATSATNAATSEANAATSETNAAGSASAAATSATNAATSETNAATSETNAAASETAAATSETNAATSETNAAGSATAAATSAANAATSETNAAGSATAAATSETNAATSASNAATSETNAATSASNASSSQTAAASSATAAATSASSASSSATLAASNAAAIDLSSLSETINDTAVDVFVYDTSKDSDGGAWRHRTQHTSWYNETLNTSTRGSRKEFPAVAVIVAEADKVTIYDGDDPSLPMWMVFNRDNNEALSFDQVAGTAPPLAPISSLTAGNALLVTGQNLSGNAQGVRLINFLSETVDRISDAARQNTWRFLGNIEQRNDNLGGYSYSSSNIVDLAANDVAMTVLPDAPTDPATGLPVPTIAVATDGGVSVIKDDGTVVDITHSLAADLFTTASFTDDNRLVTFLQGIKDVYVMPIPTSDYSVDLSSDDTTYNELSAPYLFSTFSFVAPSDLKPLATPDGLAIIRNETGAIHGISQLAEDTTTPANGMVAYTTSDYTTGWMNGDIKLAALADTTAETLSGSELVTDFSTYADQAAFDVDWTRGTGWTFNTTTGVASHAQSAGGGALSQELVLEVGKTYLISATIDTTSDATISNSSLGIRNNAETTNLATLYLDPSISKEYTLVWTATETNSKVWIYSADEITSIDNISVRLADADRSVNGKGLAVYGSITKTPVATGADVVGYSGFSSSNYLEQPYNSDLDFGTGDFCVMGWVNFSGSAYAGIAALSSERNSASNPGFSVYYNPTNLFFRVSSTEVLPTSLPPTGQWVHVCAVRTDGDNTGRIYINGQLNASSTSMGTSSSPTNNSATLVVGGYWSGAGLIADSAEKYALLRISGTAPTADQIRKIYEDEKVLFQPNAKATLTGNSDAVTALAHDPDTNLLHVGTPGGRSVFQGLRRVEEHTGTNSQSLAAISAVDGLVVEGK